LYSLSVMCLFWCEITYLWGNTDEEKNSYKKASQKREAKKIAISY
jgi:hypothetical protein